MSHCTCCGARLVCGEQALCSVNGCFLRWLQQERPDPSALAIFVCPAWKSTHDPKSLESES